MQHAIYVCDNTVIDPMTNAPVEVAIYKDIESGSLFGIDSSYLLTLDLTDPVSSPFNGKDIKLVDSPSSCFFYLVDIHYPDDQTDLNGLVCCSLDGLPDDSPYTDDDVFYYGMGIEEARLSIGRKYLHNDFIITGVESLNKEIFNMQSVNWEKISDSDMSLLNQCVVRAKTLFPTIESGGLLMDIGAVHSILPLNLQGLLHAFNLDFGHDIIGIHNHFDRESKKLTDLFCPRFAINQPVVVRRNSDE